MNRASATFTWIVDYRVQIMACAMALLSIVAAVLLVAALHREVNTQMIPLDTDNADHSNPGLNLYHAVSRGEGRDIVEAITRQAFYPPLHSIFTALSYEAYGPGLASSRLPSVYFHGVAVILMFLTAWSLLSPAYPHKNGWICLSGACMASVLLLSSPELLSEASLAMLEPLGVLAMLVILITFTWFERRPTPVSAVVLGLALLAAWFTKYSLAVPVYPAIIAVLWLRKYGASVVRPLVITVIAGLFLWVLIADPYKIWRFFTSHGSYTDFLSVDNFNFYPRALANDFLPGPATAATAYSLAIFGAIRFWKSDTVCLAVLVSLFSMAIFFVGTVNNARYLSHAVACIFLLSGLGFAGLLGWLHLRLGKELLPVFLVMLLVALGIGTKIVELKADLPSLVARKMEGHPDMWALQEFVSNTVDSRAAIIVCGLNDEFSREGLIWKLMADSTDLAGYTDIRVDRFPYSEFRLNRNRDRNRNVPAPWLDSTFPMFPMSDMLGREYYDFAVTYSDPAHSEEETRGVEHCQDAFRDYPATSLKAGERTANVYKLK